MHNHPIPTPSKFIGLAIRREGHALGMKKNMSIIMWDDMANLTLYKYVSITCHVLVSVVLSLKVVCIVIARSLSSNVIIYIRRNNSS